MSERQRTAGDGAADERGGTEEGVELHCVPLKGVSNKLNWLMYWEKEGRRQKGVILSGSFSKNFISFLSLEWNLVVVKISLALWGSGGWAGLLPSPCILLSLLLFQQPLLSRAKMGLANTNGSEQALNPPEKRVAKGTLRPHRLVSHACHSG